MSHLIHRPISYDPFISDSFLTRSTIFSDFETLFNDVFNGMVSQKSKLLDNSTGYPRMDIFVKDNKYYIQIACAGLSEKDIDIKVENQGKTITVTGSRLQKHEDAKYLSKSLTRSSFTKSLTIPDDVEGDPVANMENGLLTLEWKLKTPIEKEPQCKKIAINSCAKPPPDKLIK